MKAQNQQVHLLDYWRILLKQRRVALTLFLAVVGVASVYTFATTPVYQASSQVLVERENNQTLNFSEGGTAVIQVKDATEYFNTQKAILTSRAFADRVVRKLQLNSNPYFMELKQKRSNNLVLNIKTHIKRLFPERTGNANPFPNFKFRNELDPILTDIVLEGMVVEIGKQNNIMKVGFNAYNPAVAAGMANGAAVTFIEHNLDIRIKPYRDAVEWLSGRIVESRSRVEDSEKMLQQYKEGKGVTSFEAKESVINQQLQELVSQLVQTEGKRQEAESKYNQIKSVIDRPDLLATVPDIMNNLVIQGLRNEELALKKQLSDLSEKFGERHPQILKANSQLAMVQKNIVTEARKMLNAAKADYELAKNRELSLRQTIEDQKRQVLDLSRKAIDFNVISGESVSNKQFYELLLKKLQEASLSSGISVSNAQIVDYAAVPGSPVRPKRALNILLAVVIGLFGGVFAAFFTEYMDDTVKSAEDVDKILGLPCLDMVPLTDESKGPIFLTSDPKSAAAEAFRTIRTGVMFSSRVEHLKVLLVTSSVPNEGKTSTAANLAVAMAQMGEKVLIIDTDMRRHNLHEVLALSNTTGLSDAVLDQGRLARAIQKVAGHPNLEAITGGTLAPNPSELLGSPGMRELIAGLSATYDRIILDSPPILAFSDSLVLSKLVGGVIMVVWGGETRKDSVQQAVQSLKGAGAKILGVVLNKIDVSRKSYAYYQDYASYYADKNGVNRKTGKNK